jgi:hypothetical protein
VNRTKKDDWSFELVVTAIIFFILIIRTIVTLVGG